MSENGLGAIGKCLWCGDAIVWHNDGTLPLGWKHKLVDGTLSMYICEHNKDPRSCCGVDHHIATPDFRTPGQKQEKIGVIQGTL